MTAPPLAKYLASAEKKTRDKAVKSLSTFLSEPSQNALPKSEMDKLWKGIFYCFWMSDKPNVQNALATDLAEIMLNITEVNSALGFLQGFWETIVREWNGIDRLRMDKYYMLVRRYVNASFRLLIREDWKIVSDYNEILTRIGGPLCPSDVRVPQGLVLHLAEIYLEELDKAIRSAEDPAPVPLASILDPFYQFEARTPNATTLKKVESDVFRFLFSALDTSPKEPSDERPSKRTRVEKPYQNVIANSCVSEMIKEKATPTTLRRKLLREIFRIASEEGTKDSNRRKMYALWKEYGGEDGDEENIPH